MNFERGLMVFKYIFYIFVGRNELNFEGISNHSYLVYTIDVSVILSEARRA